MRVDGEAQPQPEALHGVEDSTCNCCSEGCSTSRSSLLNPRKAKRRGCFTRNTRQKQLTGSPSLSRLSKKYFTDSPWDGTGRISVILHHLTASEQRAAQTGSRDAAGGRVKVFDVDRSVLV